MREAEEGARERKALIDTLAERNRVSVVLLPLQVGEYFFSGPTAESVNSG